MPPAILTAPPLLVALVLFAASGCRALCGTPTNVEEPAAETGDEWLLREVAPPEIPDRLRHDLTLHGLFTDGMVLQRDTPVPIWGWATAGGRKSNSNATATFPRDDFSLAR